MALEAFLLDREMASHPGDEMAIMDKADTDLLSLPLAYRAQLESLASKLDNGTCLIFLGAGAAKDSLAKDLPGGVELSKALAEKCELEWHRYVPLSTIAFYFEQIYTRDGLNEFLRTTITDPRIGPSHTIRKLVEIVKLLERRGKQVFIITTNYDQQFERAYQNERPDGRGLQVIIYRGAEDPNDPKVKDDLHIGIKYPEYWRPAEATTYLYKMHGCISRPDGHGLVITEEDYINFLANAQHDDPQRRLAIEVRGRLALPTVLFVGYSLADWNFMVIFKATAERHLADQKVSYAVQYFSPPEVLVERQREQQRWDGAVEFWAEKKVKVVNRDAFEFMSHLRRYLDAVPGASRSTPLEGSP